MPSLGSYLGNTATHGTGTNNTYGNFLKSAIIARIQSKVIIFLPLTPPEWEYPLFPPLEGVRGRIRKKFFKSPK
jgi:hypothetical protein